MKTDRTICAVIAIVMAVLCVSCYNDEVQVYEFEFEGHTYLEFEGCGIVHNPECQCQTNKHTKQ